MAAYGWDDVPLDHGFHTYRQMERWTVSPAARVEILDRLLELNHERARAEGQDVPEPGESCSDERQPVYRRPVRVARADRAGASRAAQRSRGGDQGDTRAAYMVGALAPVTMDVGVSTGPTTGEDGEDPDAGRIRTTAAAA